MKKLQLYILGLLSFSFVGCTNLTEGFNENLNDFTDVPADLVIGQLELQAALISNSDAARIAGIFTDQFTGTERQYATLNVYSTISSDFDGFWARIYNLRAQSQIIKQKSTNSVLIGRAQMLEALALGEGAALFGDIPFSEANKPLEFPNPKYDKQADVFVEVQKLLDSALTNVGTNSIQGSVFVKNGLAYSKAIHSLKARYYLIQKNYAKAAEEALLGINLITADPDLEVFHSSSNGAENLFWQFGIEQRTGYLTVINSHLKKLLKWTTPRKLATPGNVILAATFFDADAEDLNYTLPTSPFSVAAPGDIITGTETAFIYIESLMRLNQEANARTAFNALRAGIEAKLGGVNNLPGSLFPPTTSTGEQLLKEILEEKYILMPGSLQIFHDVRRTKNLIGVPIKNSNQTKIPQRFIYPQTEKNANKNFPGFVDLFEETPNNK